MKHLQDMFEQFSMAKLWQSWNQSGEAFEKAATQYTEVKGKVVEGSKTSMNSVEGNRVKELVSQISALNMELASAMTDYNTKLLTGTLTKIEDEEQ